MLLAVKGGRPVRNADILTAMCVTIVLVMWEPRRLTTLWAFTVCYRDSDTFLLYIAREVNAFDGVRLLHLKTTERIWIKFRRCLSVRKLVWKPLNLARVALI
jgi:hypothetical protein